MPPHGLVLKGDEAMLEKFIAGSENPLFHADDAAEILDVFQRVTMSVTIRSKSQNPNQPLPPIIQQASNAPSSSADSSSRAASTSGGGVASSHQDDVEDDSGYW